MSAAIGTGALDGRRVTADASPRDLSLGRLHALRAGYLLIGLGLVVVKWPLLPGAAGLPLYEGVTLCMLVAMSGLAFLGLHHPVRMLPVLLFEAAWKILWTGLVALPKALSDDLDHDTGQVLTSCSVVVLVLAVIPWSYVWRTYVRSAGDRWR